METGEGRGEEEGRKRRGIQTNSSEESEDEEMK